MATRLDLPATWIKDSERRTRAQVPVAATFQTKAEIALALLDQANAWGVRHACVVSDADYGDNPTFLNGLASRQERAVVAVRANFSVVLQRSCTASLQRADQVRQALPRWQ